ncbi:MAG TPA: hypothetical protein VMJ12_08550, partial [Candidatus Acidoferrales bacterium]|nr:hypothetical protein [Candidatus Acidoferrales bacterium]
MRFVVVTFVTLCTGMLCLQTRAEPPPNRPAVSSQRPQVALYAYAPPTGPDLGKGRSVGEATNSIDGSGAYVTGHYRNLFVENGHSQGEVNRKLKVAFKQLFHGNPTNQAVYYSAGKNSNGPLAYVTDIKHHDVRTEGMSYGMIIAVQMNRQAEFNAIWNWS